MTERLLRVTAPHFVAGAIFAKHNGSWHVTRAAPILAWLRNVPIADIPKRLQKKGYIYEWL